MINVGIVGCGFVGSALKTWIEENNPVNVKVFVSKCGYGGKCFPKDVNAFAKLTLGMPLGRLLAVA